MDLKNKFRAWNKEKGKFDESENWAVLPNGNPIWLDEAETDELVITQYTGLYDKHGTEIAVGDILFINDMFVAEVTLDIKTTKTSGHGESYFSVGLEIASGYGNDHKDHIEIIGDKFNNPELIYKK